MVSDLLLRVRQLRSGVDLELHTCEPTDAFSGLDVVTRAQAAGGLGERLYAGITEALNEGRPAVLVMGSDSPTVPLAHIDELLATCTDVAIGLSSDGGFYAILCRRADPQMFSGITWSGPDTAAETIRAMRQCGLTVALGQEWYDVDTPDDLQKLARDPALGSATRRVLEAAALLPSP